MKLIKKIFQYGQQTVTLETGLLAKQADGAVVVSVGDMRILVTVVMKNETAIERDFLPLTVNYQERYYASGKLPGGFIKRENRPSTQETLVSRLIDRPLRPLFPEGFCQEVQVIATLISLDPAFAPDIFALIGTAAALAISGIPFHGPLAAARVGYSNGEYLLNPTIKQLQDSTLDLVIAGSEQAILMVESEARELPEDVMLAAVVYGHQQLQQAIIAINEFAAEVAKPTYQVDYHAQDPALLAQLKERIGSELELACHITEKTARKTRLLQLLTQVTQQFTNHEQPNNASVLQIKTAFYELFHQLVRQRILAGLPRLDGRTNMIVRPISIDLGVLPRAHGSVVFTRGQTQALVVTTLAPESEAQVIDVPAGETTERFILHYNFPPYATGEVGIVGTPKRREIGHGNLAKRALNAVVPSKEECPYVLRVVSEITESNGSSSMASVCGASLALMDAGIPIKAAVAGVAMGLIKEGENFAVLTDISGDEDHLGDMDFKVAGTMNGITALQMDIKINGITREIMLAALAQAQTARVHILNIMTDKITMPRQQLSEYAPRMTTMRINPEKIRDVIGKGGVVIRGLIEETGATIDIKDDGTILICTTDEATATRVCQRIAHITAEVEVGQYYTGKITKIMDFGAVVALLPNKDGLVHISQITHKRVNNIRDYLTEGQEVRVKVLEIDRMGKVKLSIKEALDSHNDN